MTKDSRSAQSGDDYGLKDDPVGSGDHEVASGECMASIALGTGHFWEKLWNLSENGELKRIRKDPNTLLTGDRVHVPPIEEKTESGATEKRHRFRRKGVPSKLRIRCLRFDKPLANLPYRLDVDGKLSEGNTDGDGRVECPIPPGAKQGVLLVSKEGREYEFRFDLGTLPPIDTTVGIKSRLANLGFDPGEINAEDNETYRAALRRFQEKEKLEMTGDPDQATRDKLAELIK